MARPTTGAVSARTRAREAVAALAAERAQRDARIAEHAEGWFKAADTIAAAEQHLREARTEQTRMVGALAEESVSVEDTASLLGISTREVRAARKQYKSLTTEAIPDVPAETSTSTQPATSTHPAPSASVPKSS